MTPTEILQSVDELAAGSAARRVSEADFNAGLADLDERMQNLTADDLDLAGTVALLEYCVNYLDGDKPVVEELLRAAAARIAREARA